MRQTQARTRRDLLEDGIADMKHGFCMAMKELLPWAAFVGGAILGLYAIRGLVVGG